MHLDYYKISYWHCRVERFKERLNIKIIKKVNGTEDGSDERPSSLDDYVYDNTTSKECNAIMKELERNPITGNPLIN